MTSAESVFRGALARLDPADTVQRALASIDIAQAEVVVLALGKAAVPMAAGARRALGARIADSVLVCPRGASPAAPLDTVVESDHPRPTAASERAGRSLLKAAGAARSDQRVLALISGGGSSLAAVPADGLSVDDKARACDLVYRAGAPISELNCVRKHLSAIKGGRLATACHAPITTLVSSDVPGDDISAVASGPTVPDPTTFGQALSIVESTCGADALPVVALGVLRRGCDGEISETPSRPRPGDEAIVVAGIGALVDAAIAGARAAGLNADRYSEDPLMICRDVQLVAAEVAQRLMSQSNAGGPACMVAGGEPTIALPETTGAGGRACHLALLVARDIAGMPGIQLLVAGSDGIDGNTPYAGAVIDGDTWARIPDPETSLATYDSATALAAAGCTITTGPTGINHADLLIAIVD